LAHKQEYSPLFAQGFHKLDLEQIRKRCVLEFPDSKVRADIMAGFEAILERAIGIELTCDVWVDGSFLTKKIDPEDIDFIFLISASIHEGGTPDQRDFIEWLISNEDDPKKSFLCHTDVVLLYEVGSPWHPLTVSTLRHWEENVYGYAVATREPKGIAVLHLEPVKKAILETPSEGPVQ
jgi:hypothetical protein